VTSSTPFFSNEPGTVRIWIASILGVLNGDNLCVSIPQ
jgi:hypothetical protein